MHTNIRSLNKNLENLEIFTASLEHKFDIFALSETWITSNDESSTENLTLPGHQNYTGTSGKGMKGGCGFFVSNRICFHLREDLTISHSNNSNEFEASWIELVSQKNNNLLIAVIYRHPKKRNDT